MRDYQPEKHNEYYLDKTLYRSTLAVIRDYDRLRMEYKAILEESPAPPDGMPRGTKVSDPTGRTAIRREEISKKLDAVEEAIKVVPKEYRLGVWNAIVNYSRYPRDADKSTYWRYKAKFVYHVAKNLYWI